MLTNSYHILYVSRDTVIWLQALLNSSHINYKSSCFDVYKVIHKDENIYWTLLYRQIIPKSIELFIINHFTPPPPHNQWYLVSQLSVEELISFNLWSMFEESLSVGGLIIQPCLWHTSRPMKIGFGMIPITSGWTAVPLSQCRLDTNILCSLDICNVSQEPNLKGGWNL